MDIKEYTWFKPRKGGQHTLIFILGFLFFPVFGILMIINSGEPGTLIGGIVVCLGGGAALVYIVIRSTASGFKYGSGSSDILLKRGRAVRHIPLTEIAAAGVLKGAELKEFLGVLSRPIAEAQLDMNLGRWWESSKIYGEITRWVSAAITETETRSGGPLSITAYTINLEGPAVFLRLKNKEILLITPGSPDEFTQRLYSASVNQIKPGECISSIPAPVLKKGAQKAVGRGRKIRIISLITFCVIASGVLVWFFNFGPGIENKVEQADTSSVNIENTEEQLNAAGYWENDSLFILVLRADKAVSSSNTEPGQIAAPEINRFAAEAIDTEFQSRTETEKSSLDEIESYLNFNAVIRFRKSMTNDKGDEFYIFHVSNDELNAGIESFYSGS